MSFALLTSPYFQRKKLLVALVGGFLALAFFVLASTPVVEKIRTIEQKQEAPSFSNRVDVWGGIVDMIQDHPILGIGPGTFAFIFTQYQPPGLSKHYTMAHNDYLHFTSEVGFPLLLLWSG